VPPGSGRSCRCHTRVAGSLNFKDKYAPNFPRVAIGSTSPGRTTTADELERLGLVAAPDPVPNVRATAPIYHSDRNRAWPNYKKCLDAAPPRNDGKGPDTSRADFTWCMLAADWGWPVDAIAGRLLYESDDAKKKGQRYADQTAENGTIAAQKNRQRVIQARGPK
jgi:hypothetical protein